MFYQRHRKRKVRVDFRTETVKSKLNVNNSPLFLFFDTVSWYELLVSEGVKEGQWI